MKKVTLFLSAVLLAIFFSPAFTLAKPEATHWGLNPIDRMKPNGEYVIYTFKDGKWLEAGSLSFDKFFRERTLDLDQYLTGNKPVLERSEGTVKIRLLQKGGGAAHIDSVFLGGMPPAEVIKDTAALKKVSKKDYDVIDAFEKNLELVFPATVKDKTLSLTARVEGKTISKTPFQFPSKNLFRQINEKSSFYTYSLNTKKDVEQPFFKEYSRTGSGHPSGVTYGWVRNDDENLYVTIDFTPDNTMDGDKDYAKVYVKTEDGLKEFKVSVPETKWGKTSFTYTDKVAYQHNLYDFKIPLSELGIKDAESVETHSNTSLLLAFETYGTALPFPFPFLFETELVATAVAFGSENNQYLVVYSKYDDIAGEFDIFGQLVDADGTPSGGEFAISDAESDQIGPDVAYDSANNRFLVVWTDFRIAEDTEEVTVIAGQLVNADGTLYGPDSDVNFPVSEHFLSLQFFPTVAYDSINNRFLVTWTDLRGLEVRIRPKENGFFNIYGQLVKADGTPYTDPVDNIVISDASGDQWYSSVAYDSANEKFLVAWMEGYIFVVRGSSLPTKHDNTVNGNGNGVRMGIYGQLVNADGTLYLTTSDVNFPISAVYIWEGLETPQFELETFKWFPSVAYDDVNERFLVAWMATEFLDGITTKSESTVKVNGGNGIYGQLVEADETPLVGSNFPIAGLIPYWLSPTSIAFDSSNNRYLVVWDNMQIGDFTVPNNLESFDIYGQHVNGDGSLYQYIFVVSFGENEEVLPDIAYNSKCQSFLVTFADIEGGAAFGEYDVGLVLLGDLDCPEDCTNSKDDDNDGLVDCDDPDCLGDKDGDGLIATPCGSDCNDWDSSINPAETEICIDGRDNDCDGLVDCNDPDCAATPETSCSNGEDDDCDGLVDCNDPDCLKDSDNDGFFAQPCGSDCNDGHANVYPGATEICDDGWDNDCDGRINCDDSDCAGTQACICQCDYDSTHPAGCISGRMTFGSSNLPLAWRTVKLVKVRPRRARMRMETLTDEDGCYRFTDLYDGRYKIIVKCGNKRKKQKKWITDEKRVNRADFWCKKN